MEHGATPGKALNQISRGEHNFKNAQVCTRRTVKESDGSWHWPLYKLFELSPLIELQQKDDITVRNPSNKCI